MLFGERMKTAIISHPDCLLHEMGYGHPEQPDRIRVINHALKHSSIRDHLIFYEAPEVTVEQLRRVHDPLYIERIFHLAPKSDLIYLDPDTAMNPFTLRAAKRAAGALVKAVDLVMDKEIASAFCNVRPPGHHAERGQAMGFCFFNNVAVGVAHALEIHKLKRVAIIDFDVHHGNGTEDIFRDDPRVMLCSSFQHPFYPFSGAETQNEHIINVPLPAGMKGSDFITYVEKIWLPKVYEFKPEMIFFSAGFDAHTQDVLANLEFEVEDYAWITRQFRALAEECCQGRMVSTLEGGYTLEVLGQCVEAHVRELVG